MIQKIEYLGAELQVDAFLQVSHLGQRKVHVLKARACNDVPSGIAESSWMTNESCFVEEQIRGRIGKLYGLAGKHIGTIETDEATANCGWGDDGSTLYITADMYIGRIRLKTKGLGF